MALWGICREIEIIMHAFAVICQYPQRFSLSLPSQWLKATVSWLLSSSYVSCPEYSHHHTITHRIGGIGGIGVRSHDSCCCIIWCRLPRPAEAHETCPSTRLGSKDKE
jgi:hypothetical protein